ncbi:hypothetical protein HDU88_008876 [Geranomyces variabilis]|nr:hypothetical protein HDU88_008876 [Geranomyces variabilis]
MKSTTSLLALAAAAFLATPAVVHADPAFSWSPRYEIGQTYQITVDFGIADPVPSDTIIFAYGPADATTLSAFTDIGPGTRVWNTGSATQRGTNWTVGAGASGEQMNALKSAQATWRLAIHTQSDLAGLDTSKQYFKLANRVSEIGEGGASASPSGSMTILPIATAGPGVSAATTMPTATRSGGVVAASASASASSAAPSSATTRGPSVEAGASSDAKAAAVPAGVVGRAAAGLAVAGGIAALGAL